MNPFGRSPYNQNQGIGFRSFDEFQTTPNQFETTQNPFQITPNQFETTRNPFQTTPNQFETTPNQFETTPQQFKINYGLSAPIPESRPSGKPYNDGDLNSYLNSIRMEVQRTGQLFRDTDFPANYLSLFPSKSSSQQIIWKRPNEISFQPKFFIDGASRFDVRQGELGDCWLLAAVSNLTLHPNLFYKIVSPNQSFDHDYFGFFYFKFWRFGKWVNVVIDDLLPTINGKLAFMHSVDRDEFWSALFEKAYAKLNGSYEGLSGGRPCTAMDDFTGGVSEIFDLKENVNPHLFDIMLQGFERGSLMACSIEPNPQIVEQRLSNGLVKGHAYSITMVKYCEINNPRWSGKVPLVRIRNPWGNEVEWNGAWSDKSQEWNYVTSDERRNLGLTFDHDGEFWISFPDFAQNFDSVEMTNVNLESLTEKDLNNHIKHKWEVKVFEGSWIKGLTAGGCANYPTTFWNNPKYYITLKEEDDGDRDMKCTMIVALLQKPRKNATAENKNLTIGFSLHPVPPNILVGGVLNDKALRSTLEIKGLTHYANHRQMSHRFHLNPGTYCIIPSTFKPDEEAEFILRVFCEKPNDLREVDNQIGFVEPNKKVIPSPAKQSNSSAEKDQFRIIFDKIAGQDQHIDWRELQNLLNSRFQAEFPSSGFGKSACRSMLAMLDFDKSGKLGFEEFFHLWSIISIWKTAYRRHDKDGSGKLNGYEFRDALLTSGFQISNNLFVNLMTIYGDEQREIAFDDFVLACIRISKVIKAFEAKDPQKRGVASFTLEEFMEETLCM